MKIAWFTPFLKNSAIGKYSKYAAEALSQYADVDIFTADTNNLYSTCLLVRNYKPDQLPNPDEYDVWIYNLGDNSIYHGSIFKALRKQRGIVISHDICLHNFFRGYYFLQEKNTQLYLDHLTALYGDHEAMRVAQAADTFESWDQLNLLEYHMNQVLVPYCDGIVVHSQYHKSFMEEIYSGPLAVVPLIYESDITNCTASDERKRRSSRLNVLTVGNVNHNKRIHSTIEVIGRSPKLREQVTLTCIGSLENTGYVEQLQQKIQRIGISDNVRLLGYADDPVLEDAYKNADVLINLRYPAYEGGSASLVEQMLKGKCVIVSDTGVYAEVPSDCVIKIDNSRELEQLECWLLRCLEEPCLIAEYGGRARKFAQANHNAGNYAAKLFDFINEVCFTEPLQQLIELYAAQLRSMKITADMEICEHLAQTIDDLYK